MKAFVERGFNVVASSRKMTRSAEIAASDRVALVDGDIADPNTAAVMYLMDAATVTGDTVYVDGGSHSGRW